MKDDILDRFKFVFLIYCYTFAQDVANRLSIVRNCGQNLDVDVKIVAFRLLAKSLIFDPLPNLIGLPLLCHSIVFYKNPQIDVAPSIGFSPSDAAVYDDCQDIF